MTGRAVALARRLRAAFGLLIALVVAAGVLGGASTLLVDRAAGGIAAIEPVALDNARALQALTDAETGVRGYQLTGDPSFLEPWRRGSAEFSRRIQSAETGAAELSAADVTRLLKRERRVGQVWLERFAAPVARSAGGPTSSTESTRKAAKAAFDTFRAANRGVDLRLTTMSRRARSQAQLTRMVALPALAVFVIGAVALAVRQRRRTADTLLTPLAALRETLARLTAGEHDTRVDVTGAPLEVVGVMRAVNALADEGDRLRAAELAAERMRAAVRDVSRTVREHLERDAVVEAAVEAIGTAMGADRVWVRELVPDGEAAGAAYARLGPLQAEWHLPRLTELGEVPLGTGDSAAMMDRLWREGGVLQADDAVHHPALQGPQGQAFLQASGAGSLLTAPLGAGDQLLGVLTIVMVGRPRAWTADEVGAVQAVAADLGRALQHARLYAQQQQLVESLRDLDRQKTDFLSTVSHELRTPLTSIAGYVELLADGDAGPVSEAQRGMLDVIDRNTRRLKTLIEDLLVLSRIESGAMRSAVEPVRVGELLAAAAQAVAPTAGRSGVRLTVDPASDAAVVLGDHSQLERVVLNLLSNAVKFTPEGGSVRVGVRVHDGELLLSVTDTGIGIPEAERRRLFTRFFRASNATERAIPGTGLGLTIVASIVEQHGGTVEVRSVEGAGTTFVVRLPAHGAGMPEQEVAFGPVSPTSGRL